MDQSGSGVLNDDLVQFANGLQAWDAKAAAGLAAVATFQRCLGGLEASKPSKEAAEVYTRLVQLAPSFRLEQYIQQQQNPTETSSDAASQLHTAINSLRAALESQQQLLVSMSAACRQYQDAVLSQTVLDLDLKAPVTSELTFTEQQAASDPADAAAGAAGQSMQAAAPVEQEPEELALLMGAVTVGLQQDLEWMEAAVSTIGLESTQEELSTLSTLWELQPFTNEAAVASIIAAAAAAAAAAAKDSRSTADA